jgi:hypothetical protein
MPEVQLKSEFRGIITFLTSETQHSKSLLLSIVERMYHGNAGYKNTKLFYDNSDNVTSILLIDSDTVTYRDNLVKVNFETSNPQNLWELWSIHLGEFQESQMMLMGVRNSQYEILKSVVNLKFTTSVYSDLYQAKLVKPVPLSLLGQINIHSGN